MSFLRSEAWSELVKLGLSNDELLYFIENVASISDRAKALLPDGSIESIMLEIKQISLCDLSLQTYD
ncbi:MAG: hypothetical protein HC784_09805 [Hydrococcus sp. CSU_1_8]|nr:hypothetical protein [Hydrococcus sp. CSU_1_8]